MSPFLHTDYLCFGIKALKFFSSISCHLVSTLSGLMPDSFFSPLATLPAAEKTIILLVTAVPDVAEETSRERERHVYLGNGTHPV